MVTSYGTGEILWRFLLWGVANNDDKHHLAKR